MVEQRISSAAWREVDAIAREYRAKMYADILYYATTGRGRRHLGLDFPPRI